MKKVTFTFNTRPFAGGNVTTKEFPDDASLSDIHEEARKMALDYVSWNFQVSDGETANPAGFVSCERGKRK